MKSGVVADAIVNANNAALQMLAETSKEVIPQMERIAQSPTVAVESVTKLAESLVAQNQGIVAAIELGRQKRAQLETTIVKSAEMINDSVKLRDEKIVQALLDQGKAAQKRSTRIIHKFPCNVDLQGILDFSYISEHLVYFTKKYSQKCSHSNDFFNVLN